MAFALLAAIGLWLANLVALVRDTKHEIDFLLDQCEANHGKCEKTEPNFITLYISTVRNIQQTDNAHQVWNVMKKNFPLANVERSTLLKHIYRTYCNVLFFFLGVCNSTVHPLGNRMCSDFYQDGVHHSNTDYVNHTCTKRWTWYRRKQITFLLEWDVTLSNLHWGLKHSSQEQTNKFSYIFFVVNLYTWANIICQGNLVTSKHKASQLCNTSLNFNNTS